VLAFLKRFTAPDAVCLDVGANIGVVTVALAGLAHHGRVIAFEPGAENCRYLRRNVSLNDLKNVDVVQAAVGRRAGEATLSVLPQHPAGSSLSSETADGCLLEQVTVLTLDTYLRDFPRLDVVKVDIEGSEPDLLDGARQSFARLRPILIVECNPIPLAAFHNHTVEGLYARLASLGPVYRLAAGGQAIPLHRCGDLKRLLDHESIVELISGIPPATAAREASWRSMARRLRDEFWRSRASRIVVALGKERFEPPGHLLWRAQILLESTTRSASLESGQRSTFDLTVSNRGGEWFSTAQHTHPCTVSYYVEKDGLPYGDLDENDRTAISRIGPKQSLQIQMTFRAPQEPGRYRVWPTIVQASYAWLNRTETIQNAPIIVHVS
jgi:FkbM family methyltransferase